MDVHKISTCAVCLVKKGGRSKGLVRITPSVETKIQDYVWPNFSVKHEVCPEVVCSNCRRNLFSLENGKNEYLSSWLIKISMVRSINHMYH